MIRVGSDEASERRLIMRRIICGLTLAAIAGIGFICICSSPVLAGTPFNVSVSGDSRGINGFDLSIGDYYRVPEKEVIVVHERGIPRDEVPDWKEEKHHGNGHGKNRD